MPSGSSTRDAHRGAVTRQVLGVGERHHVAGDLAAARRASYSTTCIDLAERPHRQPRGVAGAAGRRQHVVGAGAVVAQRDRRVRRRRRPRRRCGPGRPRRPASRGLDLEVLGGVGVDHLQALVEVVDQHDAGLLAGQRGADPLDVLGRPTTCLSSSASTSSARRSEVVTSTDGRHRVVLGLADQVGRHVGRVGACRRRGWRSRWGRPRSRCRRRP